MDTQGRPSTQHAALRLLTDADFRARALRYLLGRPTPLRTEDRRVLEQIIFEFYTSLPEIEAVLFVGVSWYTRHYEKAFFGKHRFWTADVSPAARKDGARHHVTAPVQDLDTHFRPGYFDLVLMNGVYGHGLVEQEECERAFGTCYELLRPGGHFMLGWNDVPEHRGAPLETIGQLARFAPFIFPPLAAQVYATGTASRHIFQFYRRPE